jgi:hypothetical protein
MTPEYLERLADLADPDGLWRLSPFEQMKLPASKRYQLDTGVALRRHADHKQRLLVLLGQRKSLLITPLSANGTATKTVNTPPEHQTLRTR